MISTVKTASPSVTSIELGETETLETQGGSKSGAELLITSIDEENPNVLNSTQ